MVWNRHTYFLFRFRLSEPPLESKSEASRVAGFLEARNAEIRRYFALVDMWKSISPISSDLSNLFGFPLCFVSLPFSTSLKGADETLNTSFREEAICGLIWLNSLLFMSSLGTTPFPLSLKGSQYFSNSGFNALDNSPTCLVILQKGFRATLHEKKQNSLIYQIM